MVQQLPGSNPQQGGFYQRDWQRTEREPYLEDTQLQNVPAVHVHQHADVTTIEAALKHCAKIPVRNFALIVQKENGDEVTYSSKSIAFNLNGIFAKDTKREFRRSIAEHEEGHYSNHAFPQSSMYNEFELDNSSRKYSIGGPSSELQRRSYRKSRSEESDDGSRSAKRARRGHPRRLRERSDEDTPVPVPIQEKQQLIIGNSADVEEFYFQRFKDMQQAACKIIGKAFVRLVEPKKQTHHPYTKGNEKSPPWWPSTTGENYVRHKEPDHLLKPERIRLLVHILKMIVEPKEKQCATLQKLGGLTVKALEAVTMEALSNWFADKEHRDNETKRPFLKEIFKVARYEERYKNGEVDGNTGVLVTCGDKLYAEDESDGDGMDQSKDDDDEDDLNSVILTPPESLVSPTMGHQFQPLETETSLRQMQPRLPVRSYATPDTVYPEDQSFRNMDYAQPQSPGTMDANRRFYTSQQGMYWHNQMPVSAPSSAYPTSPHTLPFLPLPTAQQPPPMTSMHHGSFSDGLPSHFDTRQRLEGLGNQLRTGSLSHPHVLPLGSHQGNFDYINHDTSYTHQPEMKHEHGMHQGELYHQQN